MDKNKNDLAVVVTTSAYASGDVKTMYLVRSSEGSTSLNFLQVDKCTDELNTESDYMYCISEFECVGYFENIYNCEDIPNIIRSLIIELNNKTESMENKLSLIADMQKHSHAETTGCSVAGTLEQIIAEYVGSPVIDDVELGRLILQNLE